MLTISGGKAFGCLPMADDSEPPFSMSLRMTPSSRASSLFSVCSTRMLSARSSDRPLLIMVANWREKTARSLRPTFLPPSPGSEISRCRPLPPPDCFTLTGT